MKRLYLLLRAQFLLYFPFSYEKNGKLFIKYFTAGSMAFFVQLIVFLILLKIYGNEYYLFSTTIAFASGTTISFILQKFWTFADNSIKRIPKQLTIFLIISILNMLLNTSLMYIFVSLSGYIRVAQLATMLVLSLSSYLLNKNITFNETDNQNFNNNGSIST